MRIFLQPPISRVGHMWNDARDRHQRIKEAFPHFSKQARHLLEVFDLLRDPTVLTAMKIGPRACSKLWVQLNWEDYRVHVNTVYKYRKETGHWAVQNGLEADYELDMVSAAAGLCLTMHMGEGDDCENSPQILEKYIAEVWAETGPESLNALAMLLNTHSDYAQKKCKSAQIWKAPFIVKLHDALLKCRAWFESDFARRSFSEVFRRIQLSGNIYL